MITPACIKHRIVSKYSVVLILFTEDVYWKKWSCLLELKRVTFSEFPGYLEKLPFLGNAIFHFILFPSFIKLHLDFIFTKT